MDLTQFTQTTKSKIDSLSTESVPRPYLGMSQLGHSCMRYLWYSFRWCFTETIDARIVRLFDRGHREEPALLKLLDCIGVNCWGDQTEAVAIHGHCKGHCDGFCSGVPEAPKTEHVTEFKTMNDRAFKDVVKNKVKVSKPIYYAQSQSYMKAFKKTRTLFMAVNKNDDNIYVERIKYDFDHAKMLIEKGESIIMSETLPKRQHPVGWYECKYCSARYVCEGSLQIQKNCRTCQYCDLLPKGEWSCSKHDLKLATDQQRLGCNCHEYIGGIGV